MDSNEFNLFNATVVKTESSGHLLLISIYAALAMTLFR